MMIGNPWFNSLTQFARLSNQNCGFFGEDDPANAGVHDVFQVNTFPPDNHHTTPAPTPAPPAPTPTAK